MREIDKAKGDYKRHETRDKRKRQETGDRIH